MGRSRTPSTPSRPQTLGRAPLNSPFEWFLTVPELLATLVQLDGVSRALLLGRDAVHLLGTVRVLLLRGRGRGFVLQGWSISTSSPPQRDRLVDALFTSAGESLSDSMSDTLDCPETSSSCSVFILCGWCVLSSFTSRKVLGGPTSKRPASTLTAPLPDRRTSLLTQGAKLEPTSS